jgi:hypothetical protein
MNRRTEKQIEREARQAHQRAENAADRAVAAFMARLDRSPPDVLEPLLLRLCDELVKRIDAHPFIHDATFKLSNALVDYRDSRWEDRFRA